MSSSLRILGLAALLGLAMGTPGLAAPDAPAVATADASTPASTPEFYALQLGSFQTEASTQSDKARLILRYPDLFGTVPMVVERATAGSSATILRLVGGHFPDAAAAQAACARLAAQQDECRVLKRGDQIRRARQAALDALATTPAAAPAIPKVAGPAPAPADGGDAEAQAAALAAMPTRPQASRSEVQAATLVPVVFTVPQPGPKPATRVLPAAGGLAGLGAAMNAPLAAAAKDLAAADRHLPSIPDHAAPTPAAGHAAAPAAAAVAGAHKLPVVDAPRTALALELNKGTLVRVDRPAGTVFVADPDIADVQVKSPSMIYLYGKHVGETVLYVVDEHDRVLVNAKVSVGYNLSTLRQAVATLVPGGTVQVGSADTSLVLSGTVPTAAMAESVRRLAARFAPDKDAVINRMQVTAPNQINLRVRVAEMSRNTLKNFGVNLDAMLSVGNFAFGIATGNPVLAAGGFLTRSTISGENATNDSLVGGFNSHGANINGLIDALNSEGVITVLAEPNLTAISGETASFLAGGEFPIPVPQGNNAVTIEFKKFGVALSFTPTLLDNNRINLRVRPEVSQLSSVGAVKIDNFTIPALTTRRADTTVELGSGQSFAIAGLLQNNSQQDLSQLPMLGDMPVLGALFRSDKFKRNETELVIIVTPYIVRPVSAAKLASPLDGLVPPNDAERIFGGVTYRQQLARRDQAPVGSQGQGLIGPTGFVLE